MASDTFYGKFYGKISMEIDWGLNGENMVNKVTRQSTY